MKDPKASAPASEAEGAGQSATLSPGMAALLRPGAPVSDPASSQVTSTPPSIPGEVRTGKWIFRGSLFFADLLLLVLAGWLILKADRPLSWVQVILCILAVTMGAWLTCLALWWEWKRNKTSH